MTNDLRAVDALVIVVSVMLAALLRFGVDGLTGESQWLYTFVGIALGGTWFAMLAAYRARDLRHLGGGNIEYQRVANATFATFGTVAIACLALQANIARGYMLVALPIGLFGLLAGRLTLRHRLVNSRRAGLFLTPAYVVGKISDIERVTEQLADRPQVGYRTIGIVPLLDGDETASSASEANATALERLTLEELPARVVRQDAPCAVIVAGDLPGGRDEIKALGWQLENTNADLILTSRLTDVAGPRIHLRPVEDLPMVHVDLPQYKGVAHIAKRAIDLSLACAALAVSWPVFLAIAIAIRVDSQGPVFFRQKRIGLRGEPFEMLKFRSMVVNAERKLAELGAENDGAGLLFKMKNDPRITKVGGFLRRYSFDELPQLLNVIGGSMSLVGPRPPLPTEVEQYEPYVSRRLLTKPGITGLWQVSGRSDLTWDESIRLDLYYVENWSPTVDVVILARTFKAVFSKSGAY